MMQAIVARLAAGPTALWLQANPNLDGLTPEQRFEITREALARAHSSAQNIFIPLAFFAMVVLIVWLVTRGRRAQMAAQMELRKQLLAKFTSGAELTAFLESKGGHQFLVEMKSQVGSRSYKGLTVGVVFTTMGLGFLGLAIWRRGQDFAPAIVSLAIGAGLLVSALLQHRLEKQSEPPISPGSGHAGPGNQPLLPT